ncbi:hypothetical protein REPUB_Repub08aG0053800 [Reevesia pubescens]
MAEAMKEKFDKYWDKYCLVLAFAVILDPRFKSKFIKFSLKKFDTDFETKTKSILEQFKKLFKEYEKVGASNSSGITRSEQVSARELDENLKVSVVFKCCFYFVIRISYISYFELFICYMFSLV